MISRLDVPEGLQRNAPAVAAAGYEHTGQTLIELATRRCGFASLSDKDVLDVGCGVRFTQAIINRNIPIKSYTGVEAYKPIVEFLNERVAAFDNRFRFIHWDVRNGMYNPEGTQFSRSTQLPLTEQFDVIWLFSVFTHMHPDDAVAMLSILRKHIRSNGRLLFSAFIDEGLVGFEDRVKDAPLLNAYYGQAYMESLIRQTGWRTEGAFEKDESNYIQHYFVCSPAGSDL